MDIEQTFYDNSNTINGLIYNSHHNPKQNGYNGHHTLNGHDQNGHHMLMDIDIENDTSLHLYHTNGNGSSSHDEFLIKIQHDYFPIENITPELIVKMNKQEKQVYIDKCRLIYTAMIE